ncbi:PEP-CTERM putative exosortase interaction domain-containing protein [Rivularia sp. PCC 7116]|uniref:PEP-CTERM sorting domain-containing protein n=1 Tax=Rivularia sp. PCC 7116 TaxID=373994 RepID=UPI00029ED399|nr:PEP-CTERM sorting domain-containing protein [Rivularia sp. PCC 7116]AFY56459.1 PEP-CTERM putative exosortase interaction domain-containing protein [Rivularia sp. PCC 7116]
MKLFNKLSIIAAGVVLGVSGFQGQANANVSVFTDRTAWENALFGASFETETFDGAETSFDPNSTGNVIGNSLNVDLIGGVGDSSPIGLTGNGFLVGEVDGSGSDALTLQFNTSSAIGGFGILGLQDDSTSSPGGLDLEEMGVEVNGEKFLISDILGLTDSSDGERVSTVENDDPISFIGFISDAEINSFNFLHGDLVAPGEVSGSNENFYIDGIVTASTTPVAVPEPASMLGLLAVTGVGAASLKRKLAKAKKA